MKYIANIFIGMLSLILASCMMWVIAAVIQVLGYGDTEAYRFFSALGVPAVFVISHTDEAIDWLSRKVN